MPNVSPQLSDRNAEADALALGPLAVAIERLAAAGSADAVLEALRAGIEDLVSAGTAWWQDARALAPPAPLSGARSEDAPAAVRSALEAAIQLEPDGDARVAACPVALGGRVWGAVALVSAPPLDAAALGRLELLASATALVLDRAAVRAYAAEEEVRREELIRGRVVAAVGRLAAGVAHEIRNPLGALMNAVSLLQESPALADDDPELAAVVRESSRRIDRIVSEFVGFARPPARELPSASMVAAVQAAVARLSELAEAMRGVRVEADLEADLPRVYADEQRLVQAVWNLVENAVQAVPGRGRIRITAVSERRAGCAGVRLMVEDSGPGVAPERRERIFAPFETDRLNGTGLGLAWVRHVVDAHDGQLGVDESGLGGACFWVWLACGGAAMQEGEKSGEDTGSR